MKKIRQDRGREEREGRPSMYRNKTGQMVTWRTEGGLRGDTRFEEEEMERETKTPTVDGTGVSPPHHLLTDNLTNLSQFRRRVFLHCTPLIWGLSLTYVEDVKSSEQAVCLLSERVVCLC